MSDREIFESDLHLEEFSSRNIDTLLYYQILKMEGLYYIWVGTEKANLGNLVAAYIPRGIETTGPAVSTLLGPMGDGESSRMAERIQKRTGKHLLLSINVPDEKLQMHAEQVIVKYLSMKD